MNMVSWNCRVLGSKEKVESSMSLVKRENPSILLIQETKLEENEVVLQCGIFFVNKRKYIYLKSIKTVQCSLFATCSATVGKPEQVACRKNLETITEILKYDVTSVMLHKYDVASIMHQKMCLPWLLPYTREFNKTEKI
jgi:hypothetical protein